MRLPLRLAFAAVALCSTVAVASETASGRELSGTLTGSYYAVPDQPNFGMAVGAVKIGALHVEGRYNYEARASASAFLGWTFSGGEDLAWSVTPLIGAVTGRLSGYIPGFEASVAYKTVDVYIEAEYVFDRHDADDNYAYAWSELGWKPVEWLRLGIVGQRTRVVANDRDLQRGLLLQVFAGPATLSAYAFNPGDASRYTILALALSF